jgi:hypothetical protein
MRHEQFWWNLPGPSAFLDDLVEDLGSAKNILLLLPEHFPPGLSRALGERIRRDEHFYFRVLDLKEEVSDFNSFPEKIIHSCLAPIENPGERPSVQTLLKSSHLKANVLWVEGINSESWFHWRRFMDEFKDACRAMDEFDRLLIIICVSGELTENPPKNEVALSVRTWKSIVSRLDILLYASRRFRDQQRLNPIHEELAISVLGELSGTDPMVADRLAEEKFQTILKPIPILEEMAHEKGWHNGFPTNNSKSDEEYWRYGMLDIRDGRRVMHSALEIAKHNLAAVNLRIWKGQVGVLFPFIEEQRRKFVDKYRSHLEVPVETEYQVLDQKEDLELGHLHFQLRKCLESHRLAPIKCCHNIRNALAHFSPADTRDILSRVFDQMANQ